MMHRIWLTLFMALVAAPAAAQQSALAEAPDYREERYWLCLPDREDVCSEPLPTTALNPEGYGATDLVRDAVNPPVDCFYLYPTVSADPAPNADWSPGTLEEIAMVRAQLARYSNLCRAFAPLYRQATFAALFTMLRGGNIDDASAVALEDARAAWRNYIEHRNAGRPFALIGHSQGARLLTQIIADEIDGTSLADRMLSAILLGGTVEVPVDKLRGGDFEHLPLCTETGETGCIIAYDSFPASSPPPADAMFGRTAAPGMTVACTNPAALTGGTAPLDSYWHAGPSIFLNFMPEPVWSSEGDAPTPFLRTEDLASAACVNREGVGYLSVVEHGYPNDARIDIVPGRVWLDGVLQRGWGFHAIDPELAQGDLLRLIAQQIDSIGR
ncbi:MAG: DUF3089 domain-containing protein [Sphingomonadaceae bacterium]